MFFTFQPLLSQTIVIWKLEFLVFGVWDNESTIKLIKAFIFANLKLYFTYICQPYNW